MSKISGEGALLPFLSLVPGAAVPLHQQLTQDLRRAILSGRLRANQRLPATRTLARELRVSRSTVVAAYEQLADEGYLESAVGAGTFVSAILRTKRSSRAAATTKTHAAPAGPLSKRGYKMVEGFGTADLSPFVARPFAPNLPALDLFPARVWNRLTSRVHRNPGRHLMNYGEPAGFRPLRRAVADYVAESRGVNCDPEQVIITSGTQKTIHLAALLLLDAGDPVLMEDPGGILAAQVFRAQRAEVRVAPVDEDGLDVAEAIKVAANAKLAYVTPSCQYPLGVTLPVSRRLALLDWAAHKSAWIFEDDEESEFRFVGRPVPSMQSMDGGRRVIYAWSFSKILFPSLRLAVMVVPPDLVEFFSVTNGLVDRGPPSIHQAVLYEFINDGYLAGHIRRMRNAYAARKEALIEALDTELSGLLDPKPVDSGLRVIAGLSHGIDDREAEKAAGQHGVTCYALSRYCRRREDMQGLMLGFAFTPQEQMREYARLLALALESLRPTHGARKAKR